MKYVALILALFMVVPLCQYLTRNSRLFPLFWQFFGLCLFLQPASPLLDIAVISWPGYPGHTKGLEISLADFLMMAMFLYLRPTERQSAIPFKVPMILYFSSVCLSITVSATPMATLFYVWQLMRMYLCFFVIAKSCAHDTRTLPSLMQGLAVGLLIQCVVVLYQKFGLGYVQATGTFGHQNMLGLVSNLNTLAIFAVVLSRPGSYVLLITPVAGLIIAAFSASRAAQGFLGAGLALQYAYSIMLAYSARKLRFGLMGVAVAAAFVPIALGALENRLASQGLTNFDSEYDERAAYKEAASMMISDYPLGVGANQFVVVANVGGYYARAGVAPVYGSRAGTVHNMYWLTLVETGYLGLLMLIGLLATAMMKAFRLAWRYRNKEDSNYLIGAGVALLFVCVHALFEWVTVISGPQYFIVVVLGIIAGVSVRLTQPEPTTSVRS